MSGTPPYAELHAHSAYSFLDGASLPEELLCRADELGYTALGLTDHDSLAGAMELAVAANDSPVQPIFGAEVTLDPQLGDAGRHLTLLVRDGHGWRNLCRLLTRAHAHTRDSNDRRLGQPSVPLERVLEHAEGLVCLTGCATRGVHDEATCRRLLDAFGPDGLRVELQRLYEQGDKRRNRQLEQLARRLGVRTVATGDVHAHTPARAMLQDAFVAIRHGMSLDACEAERRPNHCHVLARPEAMAARFRDYPDAVAETVSLAETLRFKLTGDLGYRYPLSESIDATRNLSEVCHAKFGERYPVGNPHRSEADGRLEHELRIIDSLGLSGFFLLHNEILELAREVAVEVRGPASARALLPPGRGRGSSVSSLVCYLTGLSHIDPIANDLAIGRFLHEEIESLPDIDIDFPRDIRAALIARIPKHYGSDRAALVAAFPTYRAKGAIRDLGKALGLPAGEIERVARGSEGWGGQGTVADDIRATLGEQRLKSGRWAWLAKLADEAYGLPRHQGQHPGGMVISTRPLVDCCPIVPAAMEDRQMVQWDKDSCSDAGFLKMDLLGLGILSSMERCVDEVEEVRGERIDLSRIPFDDKATFDAICGRRVTGVFQIESRAQMSSLARTQPRSLQDLTVQVALVRPGPIVGGSVNRYIQRRQGLLKDPDFVVEYLHPSLKESSEETLGQIIFQDQVIEISRAFAGFTAGEAESLRRAMSRKRSREAMDSHRQQFFTSARATHHDASEETIEQVWNMIAGFAGFGFPKSHSAAFGLAAYQSAFLHVHYTPEYLCSLLNEQPMGFYPPDSLIHDAQQEGLTILPADVNHSGADCFVTRDYKIRVGLNYVKGVQAEDITRLVSSRDAGGTFRDLSDFASRAGVNTPTLEMLAWSGACDVLAGDDRYARRTALWQLGIASPALRIKAGQQLALDLPLPEAPRLPALSDWDQMLADYASTGVSIDRHPISLLRPSLQARGALTTAELAETDHGTHVQVGGLVIARQRPATANGLTFLLLEDEHGTLNVIVPSELYERERTIVRTQPLIIVKGRLENHTDGGGAINLLARHVTVLGAPSEECVGAVRELRQSEAASTSADDFALVAPAAQNFGQGRRR